MEPALGFEPRTDGLQNRSSTAELSRHHVFLRSHGDPVPRASGFPSELYRTVARGRIVRTEPGSSLLQGVLIAFRAQTFHAPGHIDRTSSPPEA